jgi:hypothetical protein
VHRCARKTFLGNNDWTFPLRGRQQYLHAVCMQGKDTAKPRANSTHLNHTNINCTQYRVNTEILMCRNHKN